MEGKCGREGAGDGGLCCHVRGWIGIFGVLMDGGDAFWDLVGV